MLRIYKNRLPKWRQSVSFVRSRRDQWGALYRLPDSDFYKMLRIFKNRYRRGSKERKRPLALSIYFIP